MLPCTCRRKCCCFGLHTKLYRPHILLCVMSIFVIVMLANCNYNGYELNIDSINIGNDALLERQRRKLDGIDKYHYGSEDTDINEQHETLDNVIRNSKHLKQEESNSIYNYNLPLQPDLDIKHFKNTDLEQDDSNIVNNYNIPVAHNLNKNIYKDTGQIQPRKVRYDSTKFVDNKQAFDSMEYSDKHQSVNFQDKSNNQGHQYYVKNVNGHKPQTVQTKRSKRRRFNSYDTLKNVVSNTNKDRKINFDNQWGNIHVAVVHDSNEVQNHPRYPVKYQQGPHESGYNKQAGQRSFVGYQDSDLYNKKKESEDELKSIYIINNVTKAPRPMQKVNTHEVKLKQRLSAKDKRKDIRKCNKVRMQRLRNRCKDLGVSQLDSKTDDEILQLAKYIITDDKHHVLINAMPKTGCSSWKMVMLNNSGFAIDKPGQRPNGGINNWNVLNSYGLKDLGDYPVEVIRQKLKRYFNILTVRHPFERLESAYREKFTKTNKYYNDKLSPIIIAKYRHGANKTNLKSDVVNFEEFLKFSLEANNTDRHWSPIWDLAYPCVLPYHYIAKTETASRDMDYVAATKLSYGDSQGGYQYNPTQAEEDVQIHSSKVLPLFSQLDSSAQEDLLVKLLEKYMDDMELFGYRIRKDQLNNIIADCEMYSPEGMCC